MRGSRVTNKAQQMPGTVTVACKFPNGLQLRLGKFHDVDEQVMGGGVRVAKKWIENPGERVHINGPRRGVGGDDPSSPNFDGYALTHGVDADFMEAWLEANKDLDLVRNGFIKVNSKPNELKAMTREYRDMRSGLEPLDPSGDARVPKSKTPVTKRTKD